VSRPRAILERTFRSLRVRNYRFYFVAQIISMSGTWMQSVALGWLVLHLAHDDPVMLGVTVALQFGPVLFVGPWGGLIADRADKRKLLVVTASVAAILAVVLGILTWTGVARLWMVFGVALLIGVVNAVDNPSRQSFVFEMVGADDLANAVGLNSVIINASRVIGPALAGVLIYAIGLTPCFLLNGVSFLFVIAALLAMRPAELHRGRPVEREPGQLRAGFSYIWRTPELLIPLAIMAVVGTLGYNFSVVLPLMAKVVFERGGGTYGAFTTAMGAGALAGGLFAAGRPRPTRRMLVAATILFGAFSIAAALAPTLRLEVVALGVMGVFSVLFVATTNSLLQLNAAPAMRGRVMSLWAVVFLGSTPIGGPLTGVVAAAFGPRFAFAAGGAATVAAGVAAFLVLRRRRSRAAVDRYTGPAFLPDDPDAGELVNEAVAAARLSGADGDDAGG
jgi:MFS family permease